MSKFLSKGSVLLFILIGLLGVGKIAAQTELAVEVNGISKSEWKEIRIDAVNNGDIVLAESCFPALAFYFVCKNESTAQSALTALNNYLKQFGSHLQAAALGDGSKSNFDLNCQAVRNSGGGQ